VSERILSPTAPGHSATITDGPIDDPWSRINCECGWWEECLGFDAGAIAHAAYEDHLDEAVTQQQGGQMADEEQEIGSGDVAGASTVTGDGEPDGGTPESETEKKPKQATKYVVLIQSAQDDADLRAVLDGDGTLREFEGFRRDQVLADLVEEGVIEAGDDGKTPWVRIVPARGFVRLRGTEPPPSPKPAIVAEEG
jgi:hypothetical protein